MAVSRKGEDTPIETPVDSGKLPGDEKIRMSQFDLDVMLNEAREQARQEVMAEMAATDRLSRDQESREGDVVHEEDDSVSWHEDQLLTTDVLPPRPGYVQRWIRTILDGQPDHRNVARAMNRGWRPRKASTATAKVFVPKTSFEQWTDVVGVVGTILMERPVESHAKQERRTKEQTRMQMQSVNNNLLRIHRPDDSGFGSPQMEVRSKVRRGSGAREVTVMDD